MTLQNALHGYRLVAIYTCEYDSNKQGKQETLTQIVVPIWDFSSRGISDAMNLVSLGKTIIEGRGPGWIGYRPAALKPTTLLLGGPTTPFAFAFLTKSESLHRLLKSLISYGCYNTCCER